ncbi:hypothetical protein K461DRAFT_293000 [Myriangium duriaei CBS 260.36]|uniref:Uncharacterized protein n=1 Tax=Myriangium duriaei CBS 260.36 TaxID=1168546 RepID=A0A9P4J3Y5_9PEZI|nr:hypothetical protein K461DRAFT_293000 [Myriangium duriaei CBS 260.36]
MSTRRFNYPDPPREQRPPYRGDRYSAPLAVPSTRSFHQPSVAYLPLRNFHSRARWPPQPFVEDELTALQKEAGSKKVDRDDEVSERGTIDQDPILIDVNTPPSTLEPKSTRASPRGRHAALSGVPTPPVSDDEKAARGRRHGPRLETGLLPEMTRAPSPYHYSHPQASSARAWNNTVAGSPYFTTTPYSASGVPKAAQMPMNNFASHIPTTIPSKTNSGRPSANRSPTTTVGPSAAIDDADLDPIEADKRRGQRRSAKMAEPPKTSHQEQPLRPFIVKRPLLSDDNRRHTDSWMDVSREQIVDGMRRATPHMVATLSRRPSGQQSSQTSARTSTDKLSSRNSPRVSIDSVNRLPPSPPRSPRESLDRVRDTVPSQNRYSFQSSAEGSYVTSPQHSPKAGTVLPVTASAWQNAFDSNNSRMSQPPLRPVIVTRAETFHHLPPVNVKATSPTTRLECPPLPRTESLPYPVDDFMAAMPEEKDHQYYPEGLRPPQFAKTLSRAGTPFVPGSAGARPVMPKHHSFAETAPATPASPYTPRQPRQVSFALPDKATTNAQSAYTVEIPPCPHAQDVVGYNDWYTLEGCPRFDICRSCLDSVFGSTFYAAFFHKAVARSSSVGYHCDFANPWMRLAWQLTLSRQLPNLALLKELHHFLDSATPCPDTIEKEHRHWYTIMDDVKQEPMRHFHVCATDIRAIEILLPRLRGFWVPYSGKMSSSIDPTKRRCSFRSTDNSRFPLFLDSMVSLHEGVHHLPPTKVPDMRPFVKLVRHKVKLPECPRNNMVQGDLWKCYYIPSLPEFSVCEDCHDDIISPMLRADSDLAMRFNRSAQYLPAPGRSPRDSGTSFDAGTVKDASCSLFSPRMRRYFRRAVEDNDLKYLARKAKDRRRKEVELQTEARLLTTRMHEVDGQIRAYEGRPGSERVMARLEDEYDRLVDGFERCHDEWAKWE